MGGSVIPLVSARNSFISKLVTCRVPGFAAVVRTLDYLSKPAACLRGIDPIRINGRCLDMVDFPAGKVGALHVPMLAFSVGSEHKSAFFGANQHPYFAHVSSIQAAIIAG